MTAVSVTGAYKLGLVAGGSKRTKDMKTSLVLINFYSLGSTPKCSCIVWTAFKIIVRVSMCVIMAEISIDLSAT